MQMDRVRSLLGITRLDRVTNALSRKMYRVTKEMDERTDEIVLQRLGHIERMGNGKIGKRVYVGERMGSRPTAKEVN